jgi:uncharacterized lipoprotein YmbA
MRSVLAAVAAGLVLALATGCASTPTRYYTLAALAEPAPAARPASGLSVAVGPVSIPALVDRPQLVLSIDANQVQVDEFSRWAAPLADEITRVTVLNLTQLLGGAEVGPSTGGAVTNAVVKVRIDIVGFEARPGEAVLIDARWSLRRGDSTRQGRSVLREPSRGDGVDALAAAYSRALARLAADIATDLRTP